MLGNGQWGLLANPISGQNSVPLLQNTNNVEYIAQDREINIIVEIAPAKLDFFLPGACM